MSIKYHRARRHTRARYPDDRFDRYWHPLTGSMHAVGRTHNITVSEFWNIPPADVFDTAIVADQDRSLVLQWPSVSLPNSSYYIALYFADTAPNSSRTFNVFINDYSFYSGLTVTYLAFLSFRQSGFSLV
uniref:Malectin-like domain-containing protein n=1 Tax=Ananas comosus var. bracteatus TaxID=296719 RepID=A0A6V7PFD7_ANACO|nr:unnamed protein product [Ananas comosus var. bracteatus]